TTASEREADFSRRLLASGLTDFYRAAPVLLRRSVELTLDAVEATRELADRLAADRSALSAAFASSRELGDLVAVEPLGSDPHHRGRQVLRLDFASGVAVVYKPRSLEMEAGLQALTEWLEKEGCAVVPLAPRTLARHGYGWQEDVAVEAPETSE